MRYVIVGNSAAAVGAVEAIRQYDRENPLTIISDVNVNGVNLANSTIEVTTTIINDGHQPVDVGIRYQWDFHLGLDDGPTFQEIHPDGPVRTHEVEFGPPGFESYRIEDNDKNPTPPTLAVFGTGMGPSDLAPTPTPPSLVQYACWEDAWDAAFEYMVDPARDIATGASDCGGSDR